MAVAAMVLSLLVMYLAATGRLEAVWKALFPPGGK
jgi:hypothetical protein